MQVYGSQVIAQVKEQEFSTKEFKITTSSLKKFDKTKIQPVFDELKANVAKNALQEIVINAKKDLQIKIQTNIINIPFLNAAPIEKMTQADQEYDVNIYAIIEAEDINASHLRIDEIGSVDTLMNNEDDVLNSFKDWLNIQFERLDQPDQDAEKKE